MYPSGVGRGRVCTLVVLGDRWESMYPSGVGR